MIKFNSLQEVQDTAGSLLKEHGLSERWSFKFDKAVRRFGCCKTSQKLITLSRKLTELNLNYNPEKIHDVILHEIAHALVREKYGHNVQSHGVEWKAACIKIGASPERCYSANEVETIQGKYKYACKHCGREVFYHRMKKRLTACGECCKTLNNNKFSFDYLLEYKETV